jgi:integrase
MTTLAQRPARCTWQWPVDRTRYDRTLSLSTAERTALDTFVRAVEANQYYAMTALKQPLQRLIQPIQETGSVLGIHPRTLARIVNCLLQQMHRYGKPFWAWTTDEWVQAFSRQSLMAWVVFNPALAISYVLCDFHGFYCLKNLKTYALACKIFGTDLVDHALHEVRDQLQGWGYLTNHYLCPTLGILLLANRSPCLEDLTRENLVAIVQQGLAPHHRIHVGTISRALVALGILETPLSFRQSGDEMRQQMGSFDGMSEEWLAWCRRWEATSTLLPRTRRGTAGILFRVGRWLRQEHPNVTSPQQWTRELAAEYCAAVDRLTIGAWGDERHSAREHWGKPLMAASKAGYLTCMRRFFRDCQEWGWIPRTFNPSSSFATSRSIRASLGPNPRIIADDIWAKLLFAGLNLTRTDLPGATSRPGPGSLYPLEMVRAIVIVWLFAGLRSDELRRLRVGCIRWQHDDIVIPGTEVVVPKDAVCFLDVPVNKTGAAFTKPVDRYVGLAIQAWEQVRPSQPAALDRRTGEMVDFLFSNRCNIIGDGYLNESIIPMLCRAAGIPKQDARGPITSHRARSTIASQLYNSPEPMTLFELQAWLGHRSPAATQHYAKIAPTRLAKSYADAGYFERNQRVIDVLIDQAAVLNGDAAAGLPWKYYDLGHGYCTYDFFEQCAHRMACAQCAFYRPKSAYLALLIEKKQHLLQMRQAIPLTDLELATVEGDLVATDTLIAQLEDVPTPAGPSPRELKEQKGL